MGISWEPVQERLRVKPDGIAGPLTFSALLAYVAQRDVPKEAGHALALNYEPYGLDDAQRLSAFIGQTAHESGGYRYTRELWQPTATQRGYDNRRDLGNGPADGYKYRGAGYIQVTGHYWFDKIGHELGLDLVGKPEIAGQPSTAMLISLEWWRLNGMNAVADTGDVAKVTRRINGGLNGLAERAAMTDRAEAMLA